MRGNQYHYDYTKGQGRFCIEGVHMHVLLNGPPLYGYEAEITQFDEVSLIGPCDGKACRSGQPSNLGRMMKVGSDLNQALVRLFIRVDCGPVPVNL